MFKKFHILTFSLLIAFLGNAQVGDFVDKKFSPKELNEDTHVLFSDLKACHPRLYAYTTPQQFDSLANALILNIDDSLTQEEFHIRVRKLLHVIGCGHTSAMPSKDWYSAMRDSSKTIPVHVVLVEDQFYIEGIFTGDSQLIGSRILSVNGVSAAVVLQEMRSIVGRDGIGNALVDRNIERLFQTYYLFLYGMSDTYKLELERTSGEFFTVQLKAKKPSKHAIHKDHELLYERESERASFGYVDSNRKIAVLDINSFPTDKFKRFYRKSFKELSENESETLIIDVRGNSGGYFPNGNLLLRYMMDESFSMDFSKPKHLGKRSNYIKTDLPAKMTRFIFSTIPDRNKADLNRNYQIRYKPIKRNHFNGQVYIIADGWTFSTASFVTSKLKNAQRAIVVGEETGGGEVAFNAVLEWSLTLPNSGVRVSIPMYHVDVQPTMEDKGRGVMPDIPVQYNSISDRLKEVDLEMQKILEGLEQK